MPERLRIHTERLQVAAPLKAGDVTLLAVERLVLRSEGLPGLHWCWASKEPWALVIHGSAGTWAIGFDGQPMALQRLLETVAGLAAALQAVDGRTG